MEGAPPPVVHQGPPPMRGSFRGRGGPPMRGFDRGRGRGMGRCGLMGMRGGMGGPPPMMRGRGGMMRGGPPRGMGFQRGCPPRGGGPPMRGGRPPVHLQQLTQPPPPADNSTAAAGTSTAPVSTTTTTAPPPTTAPPVRGIPRGRGGPPSRGRGSYIQSTNSSTQQTQDVTKIPMNKPYRGGPPRGRCGFNQGLTRPPPNHSANTQVAPVPTLKRGAPTGPPGPKRGRYDQGPVNRQLTTKHHPQVQPVHPPPHTSYNTTAPPVQSHHTGYQGHEAMQSTDQYTQQAYTAPPPTTVYNGYGQTTYGTTATSGYPQATEYDHTQYQSYNAAAYGQQDTRYQNYTQDYSQTYGTPHGDYSAPPPDYSTQQTYDDRTYSNYDAQAYTQTYAANASGYY